ncbi:LOW QUALITY PROTEIN: hypothetical protein V2J09_022773, partial [Rumex salicifolius]
GYRSSLDYQIRILQHALEFCHESEAAQPHLLPLFNSRPKRSLFLSHSVSDNGAGVATSPPPPPPPPAADTVTVPESAPPAEDLGSFDSNVKRFDDSRWVNGTWDLKQFTKNGATDWDSVIDADWIYLVARVPYYLGELTEKFLQDDRIQVLKASLVKLREFISFCEPLELVPQEEIETSLQGGTNVLAYQRARKIARFKRQRAAESKLLEIKERKERRGHSTRVAALSTPVDAGEEDISDDDGEEEREATSYSCHYSQIYQTSNPPLRTECFVSMASVSINSNLTCVHWAGMAYYNLLGIMHLISLSFFGHAYDLLEMLKKEEDMLSSMKALQLQVLSLLYNLLVLNFNFVY